jgi:hypothetical protein
MDAALVNAADRVSSVLAAALDGEPAAQVIAIGMTSFSGSTIAASGARLSLGQTMALA